MTRKPPIGVGFVLRILATVLVLYAFGQAFLALQLLNTHNRNAESYAATKYARERGTHRDRAPRSPRSIRTPWPKYPGSIRNISSPSIMNGMRLVTEEMLVRARPDEAILYFRGAMQARGWEDFTEEYFGLRPDVIDCSGTYRNLQDPAFLKRYDTVMRTHACFRKNDQSVMIRSSEDQEPEKGRIRVSLSFMDTDSVADFAGEINRRMQRARKAARPFRVMMSRQHHGRDDYSSEVLASALSMSRFASSMDRMLRGRGWSEIPINEDMEAAIPDGAPSVTTYTRGDRMAMLTVAPGPDGKGSTGMLTEINGNP